MARKNKEVVEVLPKEVVRKMEENGAAESIAEEVQRVFLKLLKGLSFKRLDEELNNLRQKEQAGTLSDTDVDWLKKLKAVHEIRKQDIEDRVGVVLSSAKEGNKAQSERLATALVLDGLEDIPDSTVSKQQKKDIVEFAKQAVEVVRNDAEGKITSKSEVIAAHRVVSKGEAIVNENQFTETQHSTVDDIVRIEKVFEGRDTADVMKKINKLKQDQEVVTRPFNGELIRGEEHRKELKKRVERFRVKNREIADQTNDLIERGRATTNELKDLVVKEKEKGGSEKALRVLKAYRHNLRDIKRWLEEEKINEGLKADEGKKIQKKSSTLKIGEWELGTIRASASKKQRLDFVINKILGNQPLSEQTWTDDEKIDLISQALNLDPSERPRAEAIWHEVGGWDSTYGEFVERVEGLGGEIDELINPVKRAQGVNQEMVEYFMSQGLSKRQALSMARQGVIRAGVEDGDTELSPEGKAIQEQMAEFKLMIPTGEYTRDGKQVMRAETLSEYVARKTAAGEIPQGMRGASGRSVELAMITGGRKYHELSEGEKPELARKVKNGIEDMVRRIMATGDSSRAPNNQPLAWEVNDMMSWLETKEDAKFRDLWQARLASYDQSAVLGSVGKKDAHEQIAGYIPREWLVVLFEDKLDFGNYVDVDGELKQYHLTAKKVHSLLQEMVPGGKDRNDIWLGRILGAQHLDESALAKRQFMAYLLGRQRKVEFAYDTNGNFSIVNSPDNMQRAATVINGKKVNIFTEVGLNADGKWPTDEEYAAFEAYDLFAQNWFFVNQSLTRHRIELSENELERGGDERGWWAQAVNAFRKLHGRSARDYTETKNMGMPSSRDAVDSGWRSFLAWKLMAKDSRGQYLVIHKMMDKLDEAMPSMTKEQKDKFVVMFEHIAYMPERFENGRILGAKFNKHGYGGGLKATADVTHMTPKERAEIGEYFRAIGNSNNFDWKPILSNMDVDPNVLRGNLKGEAGLDVFLREYNLNELVDYNELSQGFWVDFLSYTQTQAKIWDMTADLVANLANPQLQTGFIKAIRGFDDVLANKKSVELLAKIGKESMRNLSGFESSVNKNGEETTEKWKIDSGDTQEIAKAESLGYTVKSTGFVVDENNHMVARPGKVSFFQGLNDVHAAHGWGSPWVARGFSPATWEDRRDLMFGYLRSFNISDPKIWRDAHARFNYALYAGVELEANEEPNLKTVIEHLNKEPWKYAMLPLTFIRGLYIDSPITVGDLMAGWSPFGKQLSRIFDLK